MAERNFWDMVRARWAEGKFVCVGLDSDYVKIPEFLKADESFVSTIMVNFNEAIVRATRDLVCSYKINSAFYEAQGDNGLSALARTIFFILHAAPNVPVILDKKTADIGNTNNGYVKAAFDVLGADAITVHPYLGAEALEPFLARSEKGIFVLCRTSNEGAGEFQDLEVDGEPLYCAVAGRVSDYWNTRGNCGVVVGATFPEELKEIRDIVGDMPILIPGVGFQQKNVPLEVQVERTVSAGKDSKREGMIINSSRGIIFASSDRDFAEAARQETQKLDGLVRLYR